MGESDPSPSLITSQWIERAFEEAPAVIAIHQGPEHRFVFANRRFRDSSDGRLMVGLPYAVAFPEFVAQGYLEIFDRVYRTGEPFQASGARADTPRAPGGAPEERYWNLVFQPTRDDNGEVDGLMSFAFEVSDQVFATRRAEAARQRYDDLVEGIGVMVWTIRLEGWTPLWVGGKVEAVLGIPAAAAMSPERWRQGIHSEDLERVEAARQSLRAPGDRYEVEYRLEDPDGEHRWLSESARLEQDEAGGGPVAWGLTQDVTARVASQGERERFQARVLHGQKLESLGLLAGGIAHDFNNLLTAILGHASLAELLAGPNAPSSKPIASMVAAAKRASELTHQLLAYSGKGHFRVASMNLNDEVQGIATLLRATLSKKVSLELDLADSLPVVEGDLSQIQQVLMNLVLNGAESIGEQSGSVAVRTGVQHLDERDLVGAASLTDTRPGRFAFVEVSDTGAGMDAATMGRIFDPFFTTKVSGRGLGLAAVQGIVRGHGGLIRVYSEPGSGTTFKVLLPAGGPSPDAVVATSPPIPASARALTVLVVDDEPAVRELARTVLEFGGYRVVEAEDGVEAVETFRALSADIALVLMDLTMPRMSGEEAYGELLRIRPDVRVIFSSGYNEVEATRRLLGREAQSFIQKPYTVRELLAVVRTRLA